jgi:hypothetical protein
MQDFPERCSCMHYREAEAHAVLPQICGIQIDSGLYPLVYIIKDL